MERRSLETIVRAFEEARVRYVIVGGIAVVAHGYVRFTADIDLILSLDEVNLRRAVSALEDLGFQPRPPVELGEIVSEESRARWIQEKNLRVFSLWSPDHPATELDVLLDSPIDPEAALRKAIRLEIAPGLEAHFASREDLIRMKEASGRPQDLEDIRRLREIGEGGRDD